MQQVYEATTVTNWLKDNPIRLRVAAGRVSKKELAYALNVSTSALWHKIRILRDCDEKFNALYQEKSRRTEVAVDLAEIIIRNLFDHNPEVRIEIVPAKVIPYVRK